MGRIFRLLIPRKGSAQTEDLDTNWRAIERWAQNVGGIIEIVAGANVTVTDGFGPVVTIAASGGGGGYASLTGPGQTVTPGALTQAGPFTVDGDFGVSDSPTTFAVTTSGIAGNTSGGSRLISFIAGNGNVACGVGFGAALGITGGSGNGATVEALNNGSINISSTNGQPVTIVASHDLLLSSANTGTIVGSALGDSVGFFGISGTTRPFINGSRGGNAALAALLTALDAMGLIHDATTP